MDYPVQYTAADLERDTGITLTGEGITSAVKQASLIAAAHRHIYNLIYSVGGKAYKDALINANATTLTPVLKDALQTELLYLLDAGGDYAATSGTYSAETGELVLGDNATLADKMLAPGVRAILRAAIPDLLLGVPDAPARTGGAP